MNKTIGIIALLLLILLGGWLFLRNEDTDMANEGEDIELNDVSNGPIRSVPGMSSTSTATSTAVVKEFTISSNNFFFTPKTLSVSRGDTVRITLVNSGGGHDLAIDEFNVKTKVLQVGQSETITFVADKVGEFEYYCSVGQHRQMGMKGTLTVK